jgi:riboflavin kinase/FMN adenylyltransferase
MLTAMTLGNFDGLHLGHQKLLASMKAWKAEQKVPVNCAAMTFEPHPREVLSGQKVLRLNSPEQKIKLLKQFGIDEVQVIKFDKEFSQKSADDFLNFLIRQQKFPVSYLSVGSNFFFGRNREGDSEFLKSWCEKRSIQLDLVPALEMGESNISSSRIRNCLFEGNVKAAAELLGRNYSFEETVSHGHRQGHLLGFPTANLIPPGPNQAYQMCLPNKGVYFTKTTLLETNEVYHSVTNIGVKPTLGEGHPLCIETHLLNYSGTLYEKRIAVEFIDRIRSEMKFSSLLELREQIQKDIAFATQLISTN